MHIEIYTPTQHVTIVKQGRVIAKGQWAEMQAIARAHNVFHLIEVALKLPVIGIVLET